MAVIAYGAAVKVYFINCKITIIISEVEVYCINSIIDSLYS